MNNDTPLIIGNSFFEKNGIKVNGGDFVLVAVDKVHNTIRLEPQIQALPICWESTIEDFKQNFCACND